MKTAFSCLDKAIEVNPNEPWYHYVKGRCYWELSKYSEAIKEVTKSYDLNPEESSVVETRGKIKKDWGDDEGAIKDFNLAIEIDPENSSPYNSIANLLWGEVSYDSVIGYYNKAIALEPKAKYYLNRASFNEFSGKFKEALSDYEFALKNGAERDQMTLSQTAYAAMKSDQHEKSISYQNELVSLNPKSEYAYADRALAELKARQFKKAIEDYNKSNSIRELPYNYQWLGVAYDSLKMYRESLAAFDKCISLSSQNEYAITFKANLLANAFGKKDEAIKMLNDLLERDLTKYDFIYYYRGLILCKYPDKINEGCKDLFRAKGLGYADASKALKKYCDYLK
jgi:tetratricopeptide (TPR) repeat protein